MLSIWRKAWPQQRASVRRAVLVELASRGASYDDLVTLTGYNRKSLHVMISKNADAQYDGLRASRLHSTPVDASKVEDYQRLIRAKAMSSEEAAKYVMGVTD